VPLLRLNPQLCLPRAPLLCPPGSHHLDQLV
jgi:hypothetical protein